MTEKEFIKIYRRMQKDYGLPIMDDENIKLFYKTSLLNKVSLKRLLGPELSYSYDIKTKHEIELKEDEVTFLGSKKRARFPTLIKAAREYLETHGGISLEDCKSPKLPDGRKVLKIVQRVLDKYNKEPDVHYRTRTSLRCFRIDLEKYFDSNKKSLKFKNTEYNVTLSRNPVDFLSLGRNGCDSGSCFRNGTTGNAKYRLACGKNSFVAYVQDPRDLSRKLGRCWGCYIPETKTWHFSNFYVSGINKECFLYLIKTALEKATNKKYKNLVKMPIWAGVYNNRDGVFISETKKTPEVMKGKCKIVYPNKIKLKTKIKRETYYGWYALNTSEINSSITIR